MKLDLSLSDPRTRRLLIIAGVMLLVIIVMVIMIVRSRSKFAFPTSNSGSTPPTTDDVLFTAIQNCTTQYRQALAAGQSDSNPSKTTCIKNAIDTYVGSKCPWINQNQATWFAANTGSAAYPYYQAYMNQTASTPGSQYGVSAAANYVNAVVSGTTNPIVSADIVKKARKADLTGPTRRFLANGCSGLYTPASGVDSVSSIYQGWTATQGTTVPVAGTTTTYGFYNALVTAPRILEWAIKAADAITVTSQADIAANATSTSLTVSAPVTINANTKIIVSGIGGVCTVSSAVTNSATIPISFTAQSAAQTVTTGTTINKNTQSVITRVTPLTGANGTTVGTPQDITSQAGTVVTSGGPFTGCTVVFASIDSSIQIGSQVLLSGLSIPGNITVSALSATSATLLFDTSVTVPTFPAFPIGQTIENVISIPYANPLLASNVPLHVTAKTTGASGASSPSITINATGTGITAATGTSGTQVILPTLGLPTGTNVIRVSGSSGSSYTLTNYASTSATTGTSITWPDIPVGTVILLSSGASIPTTSSSNTTFDKVGKLNGTVMPLWQIAQATGPGTFWPNFGSPSKPQPEYSLS